MDAKSRDGHRLALHMAKFFFAKRRSDDNIDLRTTHGVTGADLLPGGVRGKVTVLLLLLLSTKQYSPRAVFSCFKAAWAAIAAYCSVPLSEKQ